MTDPTYGLSDQGYRGISLYTLLAAVVVLGVLSSVAVSQFTGTSARAGALAELFRQTGQAGKRFHMDTGCWPQNVGAITSYRYSDMNMCGKPIARDVWNGPYLRPMATYEESSNIDISRFSANGLLAYSTYHRHPRLIAIRLNEAVARQTARILGANATLNQRDDGWKLSYYYPD